MLYKQHTDYKSAREEKVALNKLSEEEVVELDNDKKAAMVSNLLVVLCGDESPQPEFNAGTLYN